MPEELEGEATQPQAPSQPLPEAILDLKRRIAAAGEARKEQEAQRARALQEVLRTLNIPPTGALRHTRGRAATNPFAKRPGRGQTTQYRADKVARDTLSTDNGTPDPQPTHELFETDFDATHRRGSADTRNGRTGYNTYFGKESPDPEFTATHWTNPSWRSIASGHSKFHEDRKSARRKQGEE